MNQEFDAVVDTMRKRFMVQHVVPSVEWAQIHKDEWASVMSHIESLQATIDDWTWQESM